MRGLRAAGVSRSCACRAKGLELAGRQRHAREPQLAAPARGDLVGQRGELVQPRAGRIGVRGDGDEEEARGAPKPLAALQPHLEAERARLGARAAPAYLDAAAEGKPLGQ